MTIEIVCDSFFCHKELWISF